MSKILGVHRILVIQRSDGLFFCEELDCADRWVSNPLYATDVGGYVYQDDIARSDIEGRRVEIEISASLTGRTVDDLYENGKLK